MCLDIHDLWKYTARAFVNQKSTRMAFTVLQWLLATFLARLAQWLHLLQPSVVWMQWHGPRSGTCLTFDPYPLLLDASTGVISFKTYQMKYKWYSETYLDIYDQDKYRFSSGSHFKFTCSCTCTRIKSALLVFFKLHARCSPTCHHMTDRNSAVAKRHSIQSQRRYACFCFSSQRERLLPYSGRRPLTQPYLGPTCIGYMEMIHRFRFLWRRAVEQREELCFLEEE